jgi:RNA polymerase-associated protein LEO1
MAGEGATYQDLFGSDDEEEPQQADPAQGGDDSDVDGEREGSNGGDERDEGEGGAAEDDLDLFGEREEEEEEEERARNRSARQVLLEQDVPRAPPLALEIPELPRPKPGQLCLTRLPNILGIEPRPFDPITYDPDGEPRGGAARDHSARENVVRWRYAAGGERESNARVVRWSDGSLTLHVGSEVLLASEQALGTEHSHVFAKHTGLIECHGLISHRLHFQPATRDSATHQRMRAKAASGTSKGKERRIRMTSTLSDPEKAKEARERVRAIAPRADPRRAPRPSAASRASPPSAAPAACRARARAHPPRLALTRRATHARDAPQLEEEKNRLFMSQERAGAQFGGGGSGRWDSSFLEGDDGDAAEGDLGAIRAQLTGQKRRSPAGGRARRPSAPRARRPSGGGSARRAPAGGSARRSKRDKDDDDDDEEEMSEDGERRCAARRGAARACAQHRRASCARTHPLLAPRSHPATAATEAGSDEMEGFIVDDEDDDVGADDDDDDL